MKNVNSFVSAVLILQMGMAAANELSLEVLEENKLITELKNETDGSKKEALLNTLSNKCPFREENSELGALIPISISLNATSNISDAKKAECQMYVDNINASLSNTKKMQTLLNDPDSKLNDVSKENLEVDLKNTLAGTSGLHSLLASQCSANQGNAIVSGSNQVIGAVESGSSALAFVNPVAALVGAGAAAVGRLVVGIGGWLFNKPKNDLGDDVKDSERFINDLCAFRDLTYKYDKLANDPFEKKPEEIVEKKKDPEVEKKLIAKKIDLEIELADNKDLLTCSQNIRSSVDKLQAFSAELSPFIEKPASQRECINILNKYIDSKSDSELSPLDALAKRYNCSDSDETQINRKYVSFCKNYQSIEKMAGGDLYEKCEDENFQKSITAKFTSLTDLIFRNVQDDVKAATPAEEKIKSIQSAAKSVDDQLQRLRDGDQDEKISTEKYNALKAAMDINPITNMNTSRAMTFVGRNILGDRFDTFAEKSLKSAEVDIKEASKVLKDLVKDKKKIEGRKLFSFKKYSGKEKEEAQKEICNSAFQVKRQFINGYRSNAGIKDVCDFTKGDGIPPLKSLGVNYDSYSASAANRDNNMTNRCKKIDESVSKNNKIVKEQLSIMSGLGCEM